MLLHNECERVVERSLTEFKMKSINAVYHGICITAWYFELLEWMYLLLNAIAYQVNKSFVHWFEIKLVSPINFIVLLYLIKFIKKNILVVLAKSKSFIIV